MRWLAILMILALAAGCAFAQEAATDREVRIFKGDDPALDGIELGNWGGGSATKSKEKVLYETWAIKINTQGLYAGGRLDFIRPIALFTGGVPKNRYIQFSLFFKDSKVINPDPTNTMDVPTYAMPTTGKVRFVFFSDTGAAIAIEEPTTKLDPDDNWMRVAVPLAKFKTGDDVTEFRLKRLVITTDLATSLHLGEMKLLTDDAPIKVEPLDEGSAIITDQLMWVADANGGAASLKYSWDYDVSNGIQAERTGLVGSYVYTKAGNYTVTLTVSDVDGIKSPVSVTTTVEVGD